MPNLLQRLAGLVRRPRLPLVTWTAVEGSELFSWFGVHEVGREPLSDGGARLHLKPGGYQESVDLWADLDGEGGVRRAQLVLARAWVDGPSTAPFALDLTKSALPIFAPGTATVRDLVARLIQEIRRMPVIMHTDAVPEQRPGTAEVEAAVTAYLGRGPRAELADDTTALVLENDTAASPAVLTLTLTPAS